MAGENTFILSSSVLITAVKPWQSARKRYWQLFMKSWNSDTLQDNTSVFPTELASTPRATKARSTCSSYQGNTMSFRHAGTWRRQVFQLWRIWPHLTRKDWSRSVNTRQSRTPGLSKERFSPCSTTRVLSRSTRKTYPNCPMPSATPHPATHRLTATTMINTGVTMIQGMCPIYPAHQLQHATMSLRSVSLLQCPQQAALHSDPLPHITVQNHGHLHITRDGQPGE